MTGRNDDVAEKTRGSWVWLYADAFGFVAGKRADEILSQYGDMLDFIQLQVNYLDWEQPNVQARRCLEIAEKYGKPVTVMEPCKGGTLANLPKEAEELLKAERPDASNAFWAFRFQKPEGSDEDPFRYEQLGTGGR